jgi:phosphopantothenoylcysteine decarboxylase/phosphopantothenate--cysteine ligase
MHTEMWEHAAVQANLATLRGRGVHVLEPEAAASRWRRRRWAGLAEPERIVEAAWRSSRARAAARRRPRARDRGRHPRGDRPGALRRQSLVGKDGHAIASEARRGAARASCS